MSDAKVLNLEPLLAAAPKDREGRQRKGRRYLIEGRVLVLDAGADGFRALVRGHTAYGVSWSNRGGWRCTCPALGECAHVIACNLVWVPGTLG